MGDYRYQIAAVELDGERRPLIAEKVGGSARIRLRAAGGAGVQFGKRQAGHRGGWGAQFWMSLKRTAREGPRRWRLARMRCRPRGHFGKASGQHVDGEGIAPDFELAFNGGERGTLDDNYIRAAIGVLEGGPCCENYVDAT